MFAFVVLYVGWSIIYPVNPILAVLFILLGLFVIIRSVMGDSDILGERVKELEIENQKLRERNPIFGIAQGTVDEVGEDASKKED